MKILAALPRYAYGDPRRGDSYEYANFLPALERLGHEVLHFDTLDPSLEVAVRGDRLIAAVDRARPDIVLLVLLMHEIPIEALRELGASEALVIHWSTDDVWKYESFSRFIAPYVDVVATTHAPAVRKYRRDGFPNVVLTQWAASAACLAEPLAARDCRWDVTFVGSAHGNRRERIRALAARGVAVRCFGYGWPEGPVREEAKREIIRTSRISLNFSNTSLSWEAFPPRRINQIKARIFEVPGCGGLLLTEVAPGLATHYALGEEIGVFESDAELVDRISGLLADPDERDRIARAGYARTVSEQTYERRFATLLASAAALGKARRSSPAFAPAAAAARPAPFLKFAHRALVALCERVWGRDRGRRAARRLIFELSWRLSRERTYSRRGWMAQLYPRFPLLDVEAR